jgi:hypothetical protein
MKHLAAALMSSLKALVIDPEDEIGKKIMARVNIKKNKRKIIFYRIFFYIKRIFMLYYIIMMIKNQWQLWN